MAGADPLGKPPLVVSHRLRLDGPAELAAQALAGLPGVGPVTARGCRLLLSYDLRRVNLDAILTVVRLAGIQPSVSLVSRLHHAWIRFTDDNRLGNADHPGHGCCNRPPDGR